jgi:flagellar protein FlgJ
VLARQLTKNGYATTSALEQAVTDTAPNANDSSQASSALISNPLSPNTIPRLDPKNEPRTLPSNNDSTGDSTPRSLINSLINNGLTNTAPVSQKTSNLTPVNDQSTEFKNRMMQHAQSASRATGIPAHLMLGQAALESGWGKRELKGVDGTPSNNLFGIKATGNWDGKVVEAVTTEYINGVKQKRIEKFRAYDSYADSFKDFANLMRNNPRYEKVMANLQNVNGYAQAMQKAGYATDPNYATKLANVIQKVSPS